ncbi:MAG: hypothetical protein ABI537_02655 [Casimicrobiaceae bacterium]
MKMIPKTASTAIALVLAAGFATTASAQTIGKESAPGMAVPPTSANSRMTPDNTMKATAPGSMSEWSTEYSKSNQGRISRQAYMDESGRRWDAMDKNRQGLTSEEVGRMNGWNTDTGASSPGMTTGAPGNGVTNKARAK